MEGEDSLHVGTNGCAMVHMIHGLQAHFSSKACTPNISKLHPLTLKPKLYTQTSRCTTLVTVVQRLGPSTRSLESEVPYNTKLVRSKSLPQLLKLEPTNRILSSQTPKIRKPKPHKPRPKIDFPASCMQRLSNLPGPAKSTLSIRPGPGIDGLGLRAYSLGSRVPELTD